MVDKVTGKLTAPVQQNSMDESIEKNNIQPLHSKSALLVYSLVSKTTYLVSLILGDTTSKGSLTVDSSWLALTL